MRNHGSPLPMWPGWRKPRRNSLRSSISSNHLIAMPPSAPASPRVCCWWALPEPARHCCQRPWPGKRVLPFFIISGSEFVELFVGGRCGPVRDLFEQAKKKAPCIIFIDELDAIGKSRSGSMGVVGGNDEREQTLNQLLTEMDGFAAQGQTGDRAGRHQPARGPLMRPCCAPAVLIVRFWWTARTSPAGARSSRSTPRR